MQRRLLFLAAAGIVLPAAAWLGWACETDFRVAFLPHHQARLVTDSN